MTDIAPLPEDLVPPDSSPEPAPVVPSIPDPPNAPIEGKVWAATVGTGAGATVSALLLWVLGVTFWNASTDATAAGLAVASVPGPVEAAVALIVTAGGSFIGGYLAKHTPRP